MTHAELADYLDSTLLKPDATIEQLQQLVEDAEKFSCYAVCVNSGRIPDVLSLRPSATLSVAATIAFPLGSQLPQIKALEAATAYAQGADELDIVLNLGAAREHNWAAIRQELHLLRQTTPRAFLKLIIETCLFSNQEITTIGQIAIDSGFDMLKTSTGHLQGATPEVVSLLSSIAQGQVGVKASGGIKTLADAQIMIDAGATRLGTSAARAILEELFSSQK